MDSAELTAFILDRCRALQFHRAGVVPLEPPRRYQEYSRWLERGHHASMAYMAAPEHRAARLDLRKLLPQARTVVVVALAYAKRDLSEQSPDGNAGRGFIARYARGRDYHRVVKEKLRLLLDEISEFVGEPVAARACVDSAPVLEREFAERAGLGFVGKNTMLISPGLGSYVVLGELLLDVDAAPSQAAAETARCGECRACLDACPTGAFPAPYELDARRCISYLTIEHRGDIPPEHRRKLGNMVFGCDLCQEVCPYNSRAPDRHAPAEELTARERSHAAPNLIELLELRSGARRRLVQGRALDRASREQWVRNACVALGNGGDQEAIEALTKALGDHSAVVRRHAAWALGELGAEKELTDALENEVDDSVIEDLQEALARLRARRRSGS